MRGGVVPFNPSALNDYFGIHHCPKHVDFFPPNNKYVQDISKDIADELRKYPLVSGEVVNKRLTIGN